MPQNAYYMGFLLAVLGSLLLLATHLVRQPAERRVLLGLVVAIGVALLPAIIIVLLSMLGSEFLFAGAIVLGIAALPGFYFYTLYRRQFFGAQLKRVNRMLVLYLWMIGFTLLFLLALLLVFSYTSIFPYAASISLLSTFSLTLIALVNFAPFLVLPALRDERITLGRDSNAPGFSANRGAAALIFSLLLALPAGLLILLLSSFLNTVESSMLAGLITTLLCIITTIFGFGPFSRFFDRSVLGMTHDPKALTKVQSDRIATSLDHNTLQSMLADDLLPSLLVRQFAMLSQDTNGVLHPLMMLGITTDMLPLQTNQKPDWVRLALPLTVDSKPRGWWLFGQRDPDDRYSPQDMDTLSALAGQTALALVNIEQADNLRALYFADINRHESERTHLAVELHDDVLNQLAVMSVSLEGAGKPFLETYERAVLHIRQIINGLRPAMLNYGLAPALESLADELNERLGDEPRIVIDLPSDPARYDPQVELHLFRIVQQACNNAIRHSGCHEVRITARLGEGDAELLVSDDGRGFDVAQGFDLPALLANKHFGLAGMFERAALIGAHLHIDSQPGQGCRVSLKWPIK